MGEGRRDACGREDRERQSHVSVGECLGDQRVRHRRAVFGDALEILGDVDRRDAELIGLGDEIGWIACAFVRFAGGRPEYLFGEVADGLDDHLLVVVGRQVEVVGAVGLQPRRAARGAGHLLELTVGRADDGEDLLHAVSEPAVERVAQVVLVQELLPDDRREQRQPDVGRCSLVFLLSDGAFTPVALGRTGGLAVDCVGHLCSLAQ